MVVEKKNQKIDKILLFLDNFFISHQSLTNWIDQFTAPKLLNHIMQPQAGSRHIPFIDGLKTYSFILAAIFQTANILTVGKYLDLTGIVIEA